VSPAQPSPPSHRAPRVEVPDGSTARSHLAGSPDASPSVNGVPLSAPCARPNLLISREPRVAHEETSTSRNARKPATRRDEITNPGYETEEIMLFTLRRSNAFRRVPERIVLESTTPSTECIAASNCAVQRLSRRLRASSRLSSLMARGGS
jgi:hypothetical protein